MTDDGLVYAWLEYLVEIEETDDGYEVYWIDDFNPDVFDDDRETPEDER